LILLIYNNQAKLLNLPLLNENWKKEI
jgi:hypothetical protein